MSISKLLKIRYIKVLIAFIALIMLLGTTMVWAEEVTGEDIDGVWVYDLSYKDGDDLNTFHYWATFDGTYWEVNRPTSSSGTGNFDSFLRIQASPTEKGYNTDAKKTEFDTKVGIWTHAITLAEIPFNADSEDIGYFGREFLVDINESKGGSEIQVNDYEFWITSQADILGYAPTGEGPSTQWSGDNPEPVWVGEIDWDFNAGEFYDRALIMDYLVNPGSGWADYRVIIPNDYFMDALERYNAREDYDDLTPETAYLVLYVDHSDTDSGFEEWGVRVVEGNPSVSITKTGDALSKIGDDVTYTYEVTNTGDVALDLVNIIDDKLDTIDEFGQVGRFSDVLAVGETETVQVTHKIPAGATDPYVNIVTANYTYNGMPVMDLGGNVPTGSHSVNLFQPSVTLTKTGDATGKVTDDVTYNIRIENTSSADTPTLMFDSFVDTLVPGAVLPGELTNGLTTGEVVEFSYDYTVMEGDPDPLVNTATVHFHPDGFTNDITANDTHSVDLFQPSIDVTKVGDELSKIGDEVTYTITVYNNSSTGTPTMYFDITDTMLGINETDVVIANGDNYVIEKTMLVPEGAADPFVNTVDVHADFGPDSMFPNTFDDSARWETNLFQSSIIITKVADKTEVKVGDTVTYTITVNNKSSADTPDMEFTVNDAKLGFNTTVTLASGASKSWDVPIVVTDDMWMNDNPFVNIVTTTASPIGFPNTYEASARWSVKIYKEETAWALWNPLDESENTNMSIIKTKNWGWHLGDLDTTTSSAIEYELWAAAGQNMTENGYLVGSVEVVIDAVEKTVTVNYHVDPDYDMMEYHLWIGETPLPVVTKGKKVEMTDAPGQMTFTPGVAYSFEEFDELYVAAHAVVKIYAPMN
ncbi:MAG: hypothetical protein SCJ93_01210 [Bacillota bacterium]|nr:hypothetical protein [Bacillota bacterium]